VLRLLRERADQVPELTELCIPLAKSQDAETRGFAKEILVRLGHAPPPTAPQPLDVVIDEVIGVTFIVIPPGEFLRGSEQCLDREKPVRAVRITQSFQLGKYPVTNAQYERYLKAVGKKVRKPEYWDNRRFNQPEQPVVGVSWQEAAAYCAWAGGRLPTEAEWEYACRAGSTKEYSFGNDEQLLDEYAWYGSNSGNHTQPVGAKKPNAWGLHDMHGNVWEWCQDWFDERYYASSPAADPMGPEVGVVRVIRGGSWNDPAVYCRSSYRGRDEPSSRSDDLGFRVARSPSGQSGPIGSSPVKV
jgi:formylglycine-generating enzyme required for sulfatase activity